MEFKVKRDFASIFAWDAFLVFLLLFGIAFFFNVWVGIVVLLINISLLTIYNTSIIFASCKIENNTLTFKTGMFKYNINLNTIKKVEKSTNYYPSLSMSVDRVRLLTNTNGKEKVYYVSVLDNDKLIDLINNAIKKKEDKQPAAASKKVSTKKPAKKAAITQKKSK